MCESATPGNPFALCSLTQAEYVDKGIIKTVPDYIIAKSRKKSEPPIFKERTQPPSYGELALLRQARELELTRRVFKLVEKAFESSTVEKSKKTFDKLTAAQKDIKDATAGYEVFVVQNIMKKERAFEKSIELLKALKVLEVEYKRGRCALECLIYIQAILTTIFDGLHIYKDFIKTIVDHTDEFKVETDFTNKYYCMAFQKAKINERMLKVLRARDASEKERSDAKREHEMKMMRETKDYENLKRSRNKCVSDAYHWEKTIADLNSRTADALTTYTDVTGILNNIILVLPEAILPKETMNKRNPEKIKALGKAYRLMVECAKGTAEKRKTLTVETSVSSEEYQLLDEDEDF